MVEEVVESIQQLLKGESFDSFNRLSSDSSYLDPCLSIFENYDYSVQIRFNVCKIITILIEKFSSTTWSAEKFGDFDSWFLSLIDKEKLPNLELNDLSANPLLAKEIGRAYASLLYSYRRADANEFKNFIPRLMEHSKSSKCNFLSSLNFMIGICHYFADKQIIDFIDTEEISNILIHCISEADSSSEIGIDHLLIQSSLELMNSILSIYKCTYTINQSYDDIRKLTIENLPTGIKTIFINSSQFMQNYLAGYFKKFNNSNLKILILDILFHIVCIHVSELIEQKNIVILYEYALSDLIDFIQIIFNTTVFSPDVWEYISYICMIAYKIQINLCYDYIKNIDCYPKFISIFSDFSLKILFNFETDEIDTNSVDYFFSNSQIFSNCLKFWIMLQQNFFNFPIDFKKIIFDSISNILKKGIDFLFFALHEDSESTFTSLSEENYQFEFLSTLIHLSDLDVNFFANFFNEILARNCENYLHDRQSIENEANLALALSISSQFMLIYSSIGRNLTNYEYLNLIDSNPEIPQTSPDYDYFEIEYPIVSQILNLILEINNDDSIQNYIEFHQSSSTPFFLENSILNFIYLFRSMIFYNTSDKIKQKMRMKHPKANDTLKDEMISLLLSKICNDTKFYSIRKFDFYVDILYRIISILSIFADKTMQYSFIANEDYFKQLLNAGDFINESKHRKGYNSVLFKVLFDQPFAKSLVLFYSNQLDQLTTNFVKCLENQEGELQKFNNLLIDYSILFKSTSNEKDYSLAFYSIFPKYFKFFEEFSDQIFTNEQLTPSALSFWFNIINGVSKIKFHQYSPNGVILFKVSVKILSSFFGFFNQYANDENIGNYLKCLKRSLMIYNQIIKAQFFSFRVFEIYHDNSLIDSMNFVLNSVKKFDLKNLFNYKDIGQILTEISITLLNKHTNATFTLDIEILAFLFNILEDSIFAPNFKISINGSFQTIKTFVDFCGNNKTRDKMISLIVLLNESFNRFFLEIWQSVFRENLHIDDTIKLLRSFLSFFQCFPPSPRDVIISAIPDDFKDEFDNYLEIISQEPDKLEEMINKINDSAKRYFPYDLIFIDCFPINWNSSNPK